MEGLELESGTSLPESITADLKTTVSGFEALGVAARSLEILTENGFLDPTPIQAATIPLLNEGKDVIGIAQTGTGKTFAFGLPMLDRLLTKTPGRATEFSQGLVLAPTRELAIQIADSLVKIGRPQGLRIAVLIGGAPMNKQVNSLRARPDIIVATPGRLEDHLHQRTMNLKAISMVVLDEADRMLDMGFEPAIRRIMAALPEARQTLLFSATLPPAIENLANGYLKTPVKIEIQPDAMTADLVSQELVVVNHEAKQSFLRDLLYAHEGTALIFARTRHGARKLAKAVREMGFSAAEIHADRTLAQRRAALEGFKFGEFRFLIATDIAARGIDVKQIGLVVNYDLPDQAEDYVHRIGRTGRAGHSGRSVTIATPDQFRELRAIERTIKREIPLSEISPMNPNWPKYAPAGERNDRGFNPNGGGERRTFKGRGPAKPGDFIKPHHRHGPMQAPARDSAPNFKPGPKARFDRPSSSDGPTPERAIPEKPFVDRSTATERPFNRFEGRPDRGPSNRVTERPHGRPEGRFDSRRNDRFDARPEKPRDAADWSQYGMRDAHSAGRGMERDNRQGPGHRPERPAYGRAPEGRDSGRPYGGRPSEDRPSRPAYQQSRPPYTDRRQGQDRSQGQWGNQDARQHMDRPFKDRPQVEGRDGRFARPGRDQSGRDQSAGRPEGFRPQGQWQDRSERFPESRFNDHRGPQNRFQSDRAPQDRAHHDRTHRDRPQDVRPTDKPGFGRPAYDKPKDSGFGPKPGFKSGPKPGAKPGPKPGFRTAGPPPGTFSPKRKPSQKKR